MRRAWVVPCATLMMNAFGCEVESGIDGAGGNRQGDGGHGGAAAEPEPSVPRCRNTCSDSTDCEVPGFASMEAKNFACTDGLCVWHGCASSDCGPDRTCVTRSVDEWGYKHSVPDCFAICSVPVDCVIAPGVPAHDVDNYACVDGLCEYMGCRPGECPDEFVCVPAGSPAAPNAVVPVCVSGCGSPSDCASASPLRQESDFDCVDGACVWKGCSSNEECQAEYDAPTACVP
jgi:hypothetical protein